VRMFTVRGATSATGSGVLPRANEALFQQKGIRIGVPHPEVPWIYCNQIATTPLVKSGKESPVVRIVVGYKTPDMGFPIVPQIRFMGTTRSLTTNFYSDVQTGKRDKIRVLPTPSYSAQGAPPQIGQISEEKAFGLLTADLLYFSDDVDKWLKFVNTTNSKTWFKQPKWTWWVRNVSIEPFDQSRKTPRRLRFEIEYDPELYTQVIAYKDPVTGFVPEDVPQTIDKTQERFAPGYSVILNKRQADFSALPFEQKF